MVQHTDILEALDQMNVYLPGMKTEAEKLTALVNALTVMQEQAKEATEAAAAAELERQQASIRAAQLEDKTMRIRMKADELTSVDANLDVADALVQAAQIIKDEDVANVAVEMS